MLAVFAQAILTGLSKLVARFWSLFGIQLFFLKCEVTRCGLSAVWSVFWEPQSAPGSLKVCGVREARVGLSGETSVRAWKDFTLLAVQMI